LDEAKPDILAKLKPIAAQQAMAAMMDNAKIDLSDAFFGPAPKPSGGTAPAAK
jgi:hypothetical protein